LPPFQVSIPTLLSSTSSDALLVTDGVQVGLVAGTNTDCAKGPRADGGWDTELTFKTYVHSVLDMIPTSL
jgi:hypothetical protein